MIDPTKIIIVLIAILAIFTGGVGLGWHEKSLRVPGLLQAQQTADAGQCTKEKAVTKEATDALQKSNDDLANRLAALKLQRPTRCIPVAGTADIQHRSDRPAGRDGLSTDWLYTYAAEQCSSYWRQLKICDKFIDDERKVKK